MAGGGLWREVEFNVDIAGEFSVAAARGASHRKAPPQSQGRLRAPAGPRLFSPGRSEAMTLQTRKAFRHVTLPLSLRLFTCGSASRPHQVFLVSEAGPAVGGLNFDKEVE